MSCEKRINKRLIYNIDNECVIILVGNEVWDIKATRQQGNEATRENIFDLSPFTLAVFTFHA